MQHYQLLERNLLRSVTQNPGLLLRTKRKNEEITTEFSRQPYSPEQPPNQSQKGMGCLKVGVMMLLTIVISVGLTLWLLTTYMFPKEFKPVDLNSREEIVLSSKLRQFGLDFESPDQSVILEPGEVVDGQLQPEP